jgi:ABC-2 type transport system ATP-binding protein
MAVAPVPWLSSCLLPLHNHELMHSHSNASCQDLSTIIDLHQVNKTYPNQLAALDKVSLSVSSSELIGLIGGNGSGKSTLLRIIAGQLKPDQGRVDVFRHNALKHPIELAHKIGYISQHCALDPEMSGKDLLGYFAALYGLTATAAKQRAEALITTFDLQAFIGRRVSSYSGGQQQRLHLAIGVIHQPKLLLLDEPTNSLDPSAKAFLWHFLGTYQQLGNTVLIISHDLDDIQQHCSRVVMMDQGRIIADAAPTELMRGQIQPVLFIKTAGSVAHPAKLAESLREISADVAIHPGRESIRLTFQDGNNSDLLLKTMQVLSSHGQAISECRWQDPGLAQIYFKLTGSDLARQVPPQIHNHKPGSRKRH